MNNGKPTLWDIRYLSSVGNHSGMHVCIFEVAPYTLQISYVQYWARYTCNATHSKYHTIRFRVPCKLLQIATFLRLFLHWAGDADTERSCMNVGRWTRTIIQNKLDCFFSDVWSIHTLSVWESGSVLMCHIDLVVFAAFNTTVSQGLSVSRVWPSLTLQWHARHNNGFSASLVNRSVFPSVNKDYVCR